MPNQPLNIGIGSQEGRYGQDGAARIVNGYAELIGQQGKRQVGIYNSDGLLLFGTQSDALGTRGTIAVGDSLYWVVGKQLRKVDGGGNSTLISGVADDGRVSMARNAKAGSTQVAIVTRNGEKFILENDVLTPIEDPDLPPPNSVNYIDGYFVFTIADGRFQWSSIEEGKEYDALDFATAEANPDGLVTGHVDSRELWLFGTATIEVWQNVGNVDAPFQRLRGAPIEVGCLAGGSVQSVDNSIFWVDDRGIVRRAQGYTPVRVSTHEIERLIEAETDKANLTADTYSKIGHEYYILSGTNFTKVLDVNTGVWHDKESSGLTRWRGTGIEKFQGKVICGDLSTGDLYEITPDAFDENGNDMTMSIVTPPFHAFPNKVTHDVLYVDVVTGVGLNSSDVHLSDPELMMRYSDDGGFNWSNERTKPLGKIGERSVTVQFNRLGTSSGSKGRIYEFRVSSPVERAILGASIDFEVIAA